MAAERRVRYAVNISRGSLSGLLLAEWVFFLRGAHICLTLANVGKFFRVEAPRFSVVKYRRQRFRL